MSKPQVRCAIYTRKSSEDGLDQEFNSLDAQHEACAAYITSQRQEGWKHITQRYDDGGLSGGTLERPALKRLLDDVDGGRVDMVVVYKIDRLTRSLADFAKLVERLEAADCSFVSVTQAFNTSSSMGRLTLNVLLSFAQFEREVTAERIRDKIAASKKKGLWMGGIPPLGYDPHPDSMRRELVVNAAEAEVVRQLFDLYTTHRCLTAAAAAARQIGLHSKRHVFASGRCQGGNSFSRGHLHKILTNPIYLGLIRHKDSCWPGLHDAIIDQVTWDRVQEFLQSASARKRGASAGVEPIGPAPLKGKLRDETGDLLTPTHTQRRGKRLRYYVSNRLISGGTDVAGWRLPAQSLEAAVAGIVAAHLTDHAKRHQIFDGGPITEAVIASRSVLTLANQIEKDGCRATATLISSGQIRNGTIEISLDRVAIATAANLPAARLASALLGIEAPFHCQRRGIEMKIIAGERKPMPDATLIRALRNAHRWTGALSTGTSLRHLAQSIRHTERYIARIVPLAGLSPKIQTALMDGTAPVDLTLEQMLRRPLPLEWRDQETALGFAS